MTEIAAGAVRTLGALGRAEAACTRCPLYRDATQVVPGEGPTPAALMVVGEQPGDQEDRVGRPFVGPAGWVLDAAFERLGIERRTVFVTNAVKHFKFEPRGKRRLHKRPDAGEIERCRWWLDIERRLVQPRLIVAMGATAARGVTGKSVTISKVRGKVTALDDGGQLLVTVHPSYLLRIREEERKRAEWRAFLADLACARDWIAGHAA
jgi:DNA polymerase